MRVLIVGCGYVGFALGTELVRTGHEVFGVRRPGSAQADLEAAGIAPVSADITKPDDLANLPADYDWVVNTVASGQGGAAEYRKVYLNGLRNLLNWLRPSTPIKFVYTSSTSVYGQNDSSAVDESSPMLPRTETGQILLETERTLLAAAEEGFPAVILRAAGIYGPGRGYWFQQFLRGEATIEDDGQRLLNMIHRDDLTGIIIAALANGRAGQVYNAVDDEPVTQLDFYRWLSQRLGKPLPPHDAKPDQTARKRGPANKRLLNCKLKNELGYSFKYPTFREGYGAEILRLSQNCRQPA